MKKLAALFMVLMLMLCAAAQAETKVVDLSKEEPMVLGGVKYISVIVDGDTVITGETDLEVFVDHKSGVITLDNVRICGEQMVMLNIESEAPMVEVKLKGLNEVVNRSDSAMGAMVVLTSLKFTDGGDGVLLASGWSGMQVIGDIIIDGGKINAIAGMGDSFTAIATGDGSITVNGGRLNAQCFGDNSEFGTPGAYMNTTTDSEGDMPWKPGKVTAARGYVIKTGATPVSMSETGAYNGEKCLQVIMPELPETGDGANLAMWTAMLAMSVIGILSMRRKAY